MLGGWAPGAEMLSSAKGSLGAPQAALEAKAVGLPSPRRDQFGPCPLSFVPKGPVLWVVMMTLTSF